MRTFTYSDAKSHKFWNIELQGDKLTVTYGRIGAAGQTQTKSFKDAAAAQKEHDKLVKEKLAKGYQETTPSAKPQPRSLREALEEALVASPDDLASHMAYADWLSEQGDLRGEFVRVQLTLEDEGKSAAERKKLQEQEKKLLKAHGRDWLGELAPFLFDQKKKKGEAAWDALKCEYQFARGWLDSIEATNFTVAFTRVLARAPQLRLLRRLVLTEDSFEDEGEYEAGDDIPEDAEFPALYPLAHSPYLGNVRVLQLGEASEGNPDEFNCHLYGGAAAVGLIKRMPRLEELYLLAHAVDCNQLFDLKSLDNLRVLQVYHNTSYPLARLAKNPSLGKLTHLLCHPHALEEEPYIRLPGFKAVVRSTTLPSLTHLQLRLSDFGDKGAAEIVSSGVLKRLKLLDLRGGTITDKGALELAACPDLRNLETLNLDRNCLSAAGVAALKKTGVDFTAKKQWVLGEESDYGAPEYLFEGDIE